MQIPQSSYFQVTINPQQLWVIIQGINKQIAIQQKKIIEVQTLTSNLETVINKNVKKQQQQTNLELLNVQKTSRENYKELRTYFKDKDEKYQKKMNDFQSVISILSLKMQSIQNQLRDQFALKLSYFQKKMIGYQISQQSTKKQVADIYSLSLSLNAKYQRFEADYRLQTQKNEQFRDSLQQKLVSYDEQVLKQKQAVQKVVLGNVNKSVLRQKQKIKTQKLINLEQKVCEVRFAQKIQGISEIESMINKSKKDEANKYEQKKPKEVLRLLAQKIQAVTQTVNQKLPEIQQKVQRYTIKSEIVGQQLEILSRKLEKDKVQFNGFSQQIKVYEDKRNNEKMFENMKNSISQIGKQIKDGLETKLNREIFEKFQRNINDKISYLVQSYYEKADKLQVKKGLSFLQDKLKEVIIVIAEQRNLNKDSAVKKIACLSCDKQLQAFPENGKKQLRASFNLQARVSTPNLRKKYKNLNQTTPDEER